jgi:uncharacterized iron-regulated protein
MVLSTNAAAGEAENMTPIVVEPAKSATLPELMTKLRSERLIYVGETHTAFADHLLQLEVLRGMAARPEGLAVGVEWFQSRFQPVLDDFLAGKIDEAELLRRTEYYDRWRFDYRLYRPIIQFARDKGIPIIALNASRELTDEIQRVGINGLAEDIKQQLPDGYDFEDKVYEGQLREMFRLHDRDDALFQRFLEVQLTWDESMAQRVAGYLEANPDGRILVLAGKGHVSGRSGIPNRVTRRTGIQGTTIATFNPTSRMFNSADFLVLANQQVLPPTGLMRVLLDERDGGVFVKGFSEDSPAEIAGIEEGDQILAINGDPIEHYTDLKIAMLDRPPGSEISVTVRRDRLIGGDVNETVTFALAGASAPHG